MWGIYVKLAAIYIYPKKYHITKKLQIPVHGDLSFLVVMYGRTGVYVLLLPTSRTSLESNSAV